MRKGQVKIIPGHDGEFGRISLFDESTVEEEAQGQLKLF
jgi:PHP family Zn ribbon phosphoesterase